MALVACHIFQTRKKPYGAPVTLVGVYPPLRKPGAKVTLVAYQDSLGRGIPSSEKPGAKVALVAYQDRLQ